MEENIDVYTMFRIIINSFEVIVDNWYKNISSNIKNIIELVVESNSRPDIEEGIKTLEKYLIGQFEGYEFLENFN